MYNYLTKPERKLYDSIQAARQKETLTDFDRLVLSLKDHDWGFDVGSASEADVTAYDELERQLVTRIQLYGDEHCRTLISDAEGYQLRLPEDDFFDIYPWVKGFRYRTTTPFGRVGFALANVNDEFYEKAATSLVTLTSMGKRLGAATGRFIYSGNRTPDLKVLRAIASDPMSWPGPFTAEQFYGVAAPAAVIKELESVEVRPIRDIMRATSFNQIALECGTVNRAMIKLPGLVPLFEVFTVQFTSDYQDTYMFFTGYKE